ncbi:MAG: 50S ribosomal protein L22 [Candidatus Eisenbacteria bacterium]
MEARAVARFVRISPRKADRVLCQIRGQQVDRAQEILALSTRSSARTISKVLTSAVANAAVKNEGVAVERLFVKTAVAGDGPQLKRIMPRAQGRAFRILHRLCHITIIVAEES